ncbi:unnamed protein product [Protopolystoma xenopodis]|uniref:Uncharacterized protein n=1 Tax=Protopolystoma xenopodis TaxID=117903 RepID=A0A3S5ALM1_9PLAT|nr:unnamed protein product [Protopolystoma xenopodis]
MARMRASSFPVASIVWPEKNEAQQRPFQTHRTSRRLDADTQSSEAYNKVASSCLVVAGLLPVTKVSCRLTEESRNGLAGHAGRQSSCENDCCLSTSPTDRLDGPVGRSVLSFSAGLSFFGRLRCCATTKAVAVGPSTWSLARRMLGTAASSALLSYLAPTHSDSPYSTSPCITSPHPISIHPTPLRSTALLHPNSLHLSLPRLILHDQISFQPTPSHSTSLYLT